MASGLNEDWVANDLSRLLTDLCDTYGVERPALVVNENPNYGRRHTVKGLAAKIPGNRIGTFFPKQPGFARPTILITRFDDARHTLLHEFAHYIAGHAAGHGPLFAAKYAEVCGLYGVEPNTRYC